MWSTSISLACKISNSTSWKIVANDVNMGCFFADCRVSMVVAVCCLRLQRHNSVLHGPHISSLLLLRISAAPRSHPYRSHFLGANEVVKWKLKLIHFNLFQLHQVIHWICDKQRQWRRLPRVCWQVHGSSSHSSGMIIQVPVKYTQKETPQASFGASETNKYYWLVVSTEKYESQLGLLATQYMEKSKDGNQSTKQIRLAPSQNLAAPPSPWIRRRRLWKCWKGPQYPRENRTMKSSKWADLQPATAEKNWGFENGFDLFVANPWNLIPSLGWSTRTRCLVAPNLLRISGPELSNLHRRRNQEICHRDAPGWKKDHWLIYWRYPPCIRSVVRGYVPQNMAVCDNFSAVEVPEMATDKRSWELWVKYEIWGTSILKQTQMFGPNQPHCFSLSLSCLVSWLTCASCLDSSHNSTQRWREKQTPAGCFSGLSAAQGAHGLSDQWIVGVTIQMAGWIPAKHLHCFWMILHPTTSSWAAHPISCTFFANFQARESRYTSPNSKYPHVQTVQLSTCP